jgi:hypothetical protein
MTYKGFISGSDRPSHLDPDWGIEAFKRVLQVHKQDRVLCAQFMQFAQM